MSEFSGYGTFQAKTWFIGPEEAGSKSVNELMARVEAWNQLGATPVVDLFEFHSKIGASHLFGYSPKIQSTWRRIIQIALTLDGHTPTRPMIEQFQANQLGRTSGDTLLGELFPLPKQSVSSWPYAGLSREIPYLRDLRSYQGELRSHRISLWKDAVAKHRPKQVFFYGKLFRQAWSEIADTPLRPTPDNYHVGNSNGTTFIALQHPNARGATSNYFTRAASMACSTP